MGAELKCFTRDHKVLLFCRVGRHGPKADSMILIPFESDFQEGLYWALPRGYCITQVEDSISDTTIR